MNKLQTGTIEGISCKLIDCDTSRDASQFLSENYSELLNQVVKMGISLEKASDLLHDVYISLVDAEDHGEGFDMNKGKSDSYILVHHFVYGRLKGYSRNERYRDGSTNQFEVSTSGLVADVAEMGHVQRAYVNAVSYDDIEAAEMQLSIMDKIEFCEDFGHVTGINMRAFFERVHILAANEFDKSVFKGLREAAKYHEEFGESLKDVIEFAMCHRDAYDRLLCSMPA